MNSNFLSININDVLKGLAVAVAVAVIAGLYAAFSKEGWPTSADYLSVVKNAIIAALGYLSTKVVTNSEGKLLSKESK
jgi:hypothetical protein